MRKGCHVIEAPLALLSLRPRLRLLRVWILAPPSLSPHDPPLPALQRRPPHACMLIVICTRAHSRSRPPPAAARPTACTSTACAYRTPASSMTGSPGSRTAKSGIFILAHDQTGEPSGCWGWWCGRTGSCSRDGWVGNIIIAAWRGGWTPRRRPISGRSASTSGRTERARSVRGRGRRRAVGRVGYRAMGVCLSSRVRVGQKRTRELWPGQVGRGMSSDEDVPMRT
ncbi:hypothetical protein DFH09DRAFT_1162713 [Mycena vulgaris]|nr:hypothetical protein DFH09DRAFT_1162713 [Mycena vulgaris]